MTAVKSGIFSTDSRQRTAFAFYRRYLHSLNPTKLGICPFLRFGRCKREYRMLTDPIAMTNGLPTRCIVTRCKS